MITICGPDEVGDWEAWTDTQTDAKDGRCIGVGKTRDLAIQDAIGELREEIETLKALEGAGGKTGIMKNKVEHVSHSVIESKLITSLSNESKVAILATRSDLKCLIAALREYETISHFQTRQALIEWLEQLFAEAFGEKGRST